MKKNKEKNLKNHLKKRRVKLKNKQSKFALLKKLSNFNKKKKRI